MLQRVEDSIQMVKPCIIAAARERAAAAEPVSPDDPRLPPPVRDRIRLDPRGCWIWAGATGGSGRPTISLTKGTKSPIKPLIWAAIHGALPSGTRIIRRCENGECVSPNVGHMTPRAGNEKRGANSSGIGIGIPLGEILSMVAQDRKRRRDILERHGYPTAMLR